MKRDCRRALCLLAGTVILLLAGCGGNKQAISYFDIPAETAESTEPERTLLLTHSYSSGSPVDETAQEFARLLAERGGPAVDIYPNNTLGNVTGGFDAVAKGTVDLRIGGGGSELMTILSWLPSFDDVTLEDLVGELQVGNEIYGLLEEEYRQRGVQLLGILKPEYRQLTSNRRIEKVEDFEGLHIRTVTGTNDNMFWETLGAVPDNSYQVEQVYTALQMGLVEAEENPLATICSRRFYEQQDYLIETNLRLQINVLFINLDTWNSLDKEMQEVFREAAAGAICKGNELSGQEVEENYRLAAEHMEIIAFPEEEKQKIRAGAGALIRNRIVEQYGDGMLSLVREIVAAGRMPAVK